MNKTAIEGFPQEIIDKMLFYQEQQGNKRDLKVFQKSRVADCEQGGFDWAATDEGRDFWGKVINDRLFDVYSKKYPEVAITTAEQKLEATNELPKLETYTARDLEIAFCLGLLNQKTLSADDLSDQLSHHKFVMIKKYIDELKNGEEK